VNIYSNVVHENSSSFFPPAYAEPLLSCYLTPTRSITDRGASHLRILAFPFEMRSL